jgi:hypothetical protein
LVDVHELDVVRLRRTVLGLGSEGLVWVPGGTVGAVIRAPGDSRLRSLRPFPRVRETLVEIEVVDEVSGETTAFLAASIDDFDVVWRVGDARGGLQHGDGDAVPR